MLLFFLHIEILKMFLLYNMMCISYSLDLDDMCFTLSVTTSLAGIVCL